MEKFSFYLSGWKQGDQWWDHKTRRIKVPELENIEARDLETASIVARTVFTTIAEKYLGENYDNPEYCHRFFRSNGWEYAIRPIREKSFNVEMAGTNEQRSVEKIKTTVHAIFGKFENEGHKGEIAMSLYNQLCKIHMGKEVTHFHNLITIYDSSEKSVEKIKIKFISRD